VGKREVEEENYKNRQAKDENRIVPQEFQVQNNDGPGYHAVTGLVSRKQRI
jgi:hypothetical protein